MSPAELGRLKAEKEARINADQAIAKRKQEELRLQQMQRMQMATANGVSGFVNGHRTPLIELKLDSNKRQYLTSNK